MKRRARGTIGLSFVGLITAAGSASAGVSYLSGTAFYQHTPVNGSPTGVVSTSDASIPSSSNLPGVGYTINNTTTLNAEPGSSSTGVGRAGFTANTTTVAVALKSGTGISQADPAAAPAQAFSQLKIDFRDLTALKWDVTSPGFGSPSSLYGSYTVAGSIGAGGFARFFANLAFYKNSISGANSLGSIVLDSGTMTTAGPFLTTLTRTVGIPAQPTGTDILMIGTIVFQADNHAGPTEVFVTDSAVGGSQSISTSTYTGNTGNGEWSQFGNWQQDNEPANGPNASGERAYLPDDFGTARGIDLGAPIQVAILETCGSATTSLQNGTTLGFQNQGSAPTMLWQRNIVGDPALNVAVPVRLASQEFIVVNDSLNPIALQQGLETTLPNTRLTKEGPGTLVLSGVVDHSSTNGAFYDVKEGQIQFLSDISSLPLTSFVSSINVGTAGLAATASFSAPQKLTTLALGQKGSAVLSIPGRTAIAVDNLSVNTSTGSSARLDLRNDGIVVVVATGTAELNNVRSLITSGYASGLWNGVGINSSVAAANPGLAVGYAQVSQITSAPSITFLGQFADSNDVVARLTLGGDTNLDGDVDIDDFARLASRFNLPGSWSQADFNYSGTTDIDDFAILASNFNQMLPADLPRGSAVPEPAALATLTLLLPGTRRRRN